MASIQLKDLSLRFPVITEAGASLRKQLVRMSTGGSISSDNSHTVHIQALKDISLTLVDGDRVGLVGHNGSGKSSLLRTLAGIYTPSSGTRHLQGSVRALFELGVGMDHELSGRANIDRLARLYGFPLRKVQQDIAEIEEFSGLGGYLDLPIRSYSSGMQLRLIFAISTLYSSDILLIDEVFGVGDESFQEKARQRMENMMHSSKIVVMASHSKELLNKFCNKTIRLESGSIVAIESIKERV
ncbi:ABC transporter ATP-binding protein [Pseudomonas vanderleydeniana]|uniref:ATP-binding cassette domain-containing protein n=1 Tax=Pseudomonas vanderleydeniana TaxID=2745495 RepID=A0A9E6PPT8_9PSED|nr:ATP-binding cassette domain-containing protein [Pseudomonas vanderleydeniana]QXI30471.1 ATP-binding cassette domain-containing protein [Pseudomonas vanderleydeniana]